MVRSHPRIRAAVVGLGIGRDHIKGFRRHPHCDVVAIADPNQELRAEVSRALRVPAAYPDLQTLLDSERPDVVSLAVPNHLHAPLTIQAMEAGAHVLCEKPMAHTLQDAQRMQAAAERTGRRLMINFSFRFSATARALKGVVDDGKLGDIYYARSVWHRRDGIPGRTGWFSDRVRSGGGPLIDLGVHRLDLALWLMGYPRPVSVSAVDFNARGTERMGTGFTVEDMAAAFIRLDSGAVLSLEASWIGHIRERELMETRLVGTRGGLKQWNLKEGYEFAAEYYTTGPKGPVNQPIARRQQAEPSQYEFVDAILADRPHPAPGTEGLVVQEILDAIYRSAAQTGGASATIPRSPALP